MLNQLALPTLEKHRKIASLSMFYKINHGLVRIKFPDHIKSTLRKIKDLSEIENTSHFFLHCNLYGQLRHALLDRVSTYCQPTVNVYLYGNTDLADVENAELFSAVQDYILKTKRFC